VGWVGHESSSYRELTVEENVAFVAAAHGLGGTGVKACLARVGASDFAGRRVGTLSRGQKQRVALARGIVHAPDLLLLDEPFTGLDVGGCEMLESVLLRERERGVIVLVVSHDPELVKRLQAEALWIERGRVRLSRGGDSADPNQSVGSAGSEQAHGS
jgi:ABC-type multidrug transport system ATPase subunit